MKKIITLSLVLLSMRSISQQLIQNGNFSSLSSSWTTNGNWFISSSFSCYSSSSAYAYFGDASGSPVNYGYGSVYQQVTIPSSASSATLTFKISINTYESPSSTVYDIMDVQLRSTSQSLLYTFDSFSNLDGDPLPGCQGYQLQSYNVPSSYFGQAININFQGATDYADGTVFRIDDVSLTYVSSPQNGSVNVTINPSAAVSAGATWQLDGTGSWNNTNTTISISAGNHFINYNASVPGWTAPSNQNITVTANQTTNQTGTYTQNPQSGSVNVVINPSAAVSAGATWQLDGTGNWNYTNTTISASAGSHFINYNTSVPGWTAPSNQNITVTANQTTNQTGTYTQNPQSGSVNVVINPSAAVSAGATWQLDGTGNWNYTNTTISASAGSHFINYNTSVPGWTAPSNQNITVTANQTTNQTGTYTQNPQNGMVNVTINPSAAIVAGATWQLDGVGAWNASGNPIAASAGSHFVNFNSSVPNWTAPSNLNIVVIANQTVSVAGTYTASTTPTITVTAPNGGEDWVIGTNHVITGTVSNNITNVQLEYSTNNGLTYLSIGSVMPSSGAFSYNWFVPMTPSVNCKLKVTGYSPSGTLTDFSDANFTISMGCMPTNDDYPPNAAPGNNLPDVWGFAGFNCTSWVAWCMNKYMGYTAVPGTYGFTDSFVESHPVNLGHAASWQAELSPYYICDAIPEVGAIAFYEANHPGVGALGHVALVTCINGSMVTMSEYNWSPYAHGIRTVDISQPDMGGNRVPYCYIHIISGAGSVGIDPVQTSQSTFSIFPNPANDVIKFSLTEASSQRIDIFNATGQLVKSVSVIGESMVTISMSDMPEGFYFATVYGDAEVSTQKFEIIH